MLYFYNKIISIPSWY